MRYYIDCNRTPGTVFPGGCQCANGDCGRRAVDCNHFRYGQCNTQIAGTDRGRLPARDLPEPRHRARMNCNGTEMVDNRTCVHEADCLKGLAKQLPGGGGA